MKHIIPFALVTIMAGGCGDAPARQVWENTFAGDGEDLFLEDDDFACLSDSRWDVVDGTRIWNPLGRQTEAVARAAQKDLGEYPVGTVIQLFPDEAMVKRGRGFSTETHDWEYLVLHVASGESVITSRGTTEVKNAAGSCLSCHSASSAFDSVCFTNTSCAPLPFFIDTNVDPVTEDPRCGG